MGTDVVTRCRLCRIEPAIRLDDSGLCANPVEPDDPRPRVGTCADLVSHLGRRMAKGGYARLRTKQRTQDEAIRLLGFVAGEYGFSLSYEVGESWVVATATKLETPVRKPSGKRTLVEGYDLATLDIAKIHLDGIEAKRKATMYARMAELEDGWLDAAIAATSEAALLDRLIAAWEAQYG